ncbi:MAG TPA: DUF5979 domain-containing protein, partial [Acidimicrobiia bacterium]|nr:DUF5979 domain-containing protein [Acidimicrobiia bacterium]
DDGTAHDGTIGFSTTGTLITTGTGVGSITSLPITGIPAGTQCTVTETGQGGASSVVITGSPAAIVTGQVAQVTVTNTFISVGGNITVRLDVDKQVFGSVSPPDNTQYVVNVSCTGATTVNENLTFTYPNGLGVQSITRQISSLGALNCTVSETGEGQGVLLGYEVDGGAIQAAAPVVDLNINRPSASVRVVNDPTSGIQVAGISVTGATASLASTGADSGFLLAGGGALLGIGIAALLGTRRRRREPLLG